MKKSNSISTNKVFQVLTSAFKREELKMIKTSTAKAMTIQSDLFDSEGSIQIDTQRQLLRDLMFLNMKHYRQQVFLKSHADSYLHGAKDSCCDLDESQ